MARAFYTIGHSTRTIAGFAALLQSVGVGRVVDVRSVPRSRTNSQYNVTVLPAHLAAYAIEYEHLADLGGLRRRSESVAAHVNGFWRHPGFHNYADYALSQAFDRGLDRLLALGTDDTCALMCAEAVWWRCHRRIIADYLLARGAAVYHLMGSDRIQPARLTPGAQTSNDGKVTYPAGGMLDPIVNTEITWIY